jgi:succinoglycan biosynthesis protein ExoM
VTLTGTADGMVAARVQPIDAVTAKRTHHLCVCICTFKRPELLKRLLASLASQRTAALFTYSVVVADNDAMKSAEPVVAAFSSQSPLHVTYCFEPQQNIALARNRAIEHASGDFVVFIDDDEFPVQDWLRNLLETYLAYGVDGVLGPVNPWFECDPPSWVRKGGFFDRPNHATGYKLSWAECRTGNVLFRRSVLDGVATPFRSEFDTAGEDMDFFRRMINKGCAFIWCSDAVVYEVVPAARCTRSFLLRRALLRGSNFRKHPTDRLKNLLRSMVAVPSYTLALPILAVCGQHVFFKYLVKLCDHASRLLAFLGLSVVTQRET